MQKINFLFGIHCHQPVGNFEHIMEESYSRCYLPFFQVMERHPEIKFSFHFSGILYEWFLHHHPEFMELLRDVVKRKQAEVLAAGHFEPILPIIPDRDKVGQISMQIDFVKKHLHTTPRGLWLTERVWEPHLPKVLSKAGIEYITVDDYHFLSAGIPEKDLNGYFVTEEEGSSLKIFPISKRLRYLIPFQVPNETIKYLSQVAQEGEEAAAILADDGEKFGLWPGTHKWVYEDGYLEDLLKNLKHNVSWINPMTFSEYIEKNPSRGRIYLPTASYFEMMRWALFTDRGKQLNHIIEDLKKQNRYEEFEPFFKGGYFRNFFVKYPEANTMHKKMLQVSAKLKTAKTSNHKLVEDAKRELYMGQCCCAYWHGVFGGLYLSYLRSAVFEHLIKAENIITKIARGGSAYTEVVVTDFDCDGAEEVILSNDQLNVYFSPSNGAGIFELDYKPKAFNVLNNLSRREEVYHEKIRLKTKTADSVNVQSIHNRVKAKEKGLDSFLVYDSYRRMSLLDHFFEPDISLHQFNVSSYKEIGDFLGGSYDVFPHRKKEEAGVTFSRNGTVEIKPGQPIPIKLNKKISLHSGQSILNIEYQITNLSDEEAVLWFAPEFNFILSAGHADDRYYEIKGKNIKDRNLDSTGILDKVKELKLVDAYVGFNVSLVFDDPAILWRFPIETVSQSEEGFERNYQGSVIIPIWQINLASHKHWNKKINLRLES